MITFKEQTYSWKGHEERNLVVISQLFKRGMNPGMQDYEYWKGGFCGSPYLHLLVTEDLNTKNIKAELGIQDNDDYDVYVPYQDVTPKQVHEIINWMKDHEYADIDEYKNYVDILRVNL